MNHLGICSSKNFLSDSLKFFFFERIPGGISVKISGGISEELHGRFSKKNPFLQEFLRESLKEFLGCSIEGFVKESL